MDLLGTWFDTENSVENFSERQGDDFVEIAASEVWPITYDDIKLHNRW